MTKGGETHDTADKSARRSPRLLRGPDAQADAEPSARRMTLGQCIRDALSYAAAHTQMTDTQRVDLLLRILTVFLQRHMDD